MVWDSSVGPAILLATDTSPDSVGIVLPAAVEGAPEANSAANSAAGPDRLVLPAGAKVDLFGRSGSMGSATLSGVPAANVASVASHGCTQWPRTHVVGAANGWRVALLAGQASAVPLDSLRGFPADSMQLAAEVARLAATTAGGRDTAFAGVPFVARSVYRFRVGGADALVASLHRSIPSEANPREEQTFLIAERQPGDSVYHVGFTRRSAGVDEPAQVIDPLAALMLRNSHRAAIVVSEEHEDGGSVGLIERTAPGQWRETWRSTYVGC